MGKNKAIIAGVSLILMVGMVVGLLIGISHSNRSSNNEGKKDSDFSTGMKTVKAVCESTSHKDACVDTLSEVAKNETIDPKEFIRVAVSATLDRVRAVMTNSMVKDEKRLAICKRLLQSAINELEESINVINENDLKTVNERVPDLANWLSAVVYYHERCRDEILDPKLKSPMTKLLLNSTQLTSNALAIIVDFSQILRALNLPVDIDIPKSRFLEAAEEEPIEVDNKGYPTWLSGADRRLLVGIGNPTPNAVVAKDGSGQYRTIASAVTAIPRNHKGRYVIYVKAGVYQEQVRLDYYQNDVFMYGDGPTLSVITWNKHLPGGNGQGLTNETATFTALGTGFMAKSMGFKNTAGPEGFQAVALLVESDMSAFFNCRMDGYQDTLWAATHRQFYRNCIIGGTIDFIFGDSLALIQQSTIIVKKPMNGQVNVVTAQGKSDIKETTAFVIQDCRIMADLILLQTKFPTYLGRPWKQYSTTVIMESDLGGFISPEGWLGENYNEKTCYYAEYANSGPGANTARRIGWSTFHVLHKPGEAIRWTARNLLKGNDWLMRTTFPFYLDFKQ